MTPSPLHTTVEYLNFAKKIEQSFQLYETYKMSNTNNEAGFAGSWRCWSSMKIDGDERIPMLFRLWPEPWDNSIRYGALNIWNRIIFNADKFDTNIRDDGCGFSQEGEERFLQLAAENDANEASRYGWGLKAFLAAAAPGYFDPWEIATRYTNTARPNIYKTPYKGKFTTCKSGSSDMLFPSGTSITVHPQASKFNTSKLSYMNAQEMANLFKEIVCTRYSETILRKVRFHFIITGADNVTVELDSWAAEAEWHSLEYCLKQAVECGLATVLMPETVRPVVAGRLHARHTVYQIKPMLKKKNIDYGPLTPFPLYGRRTIDSTLIHHFNNERMIEALPKGIATGKRFHNSENGQIGFVQFIPTNPEIDYSLMPRPATIKTSYLDTTHEWLNWTIMLKDIYSNTVSDSASASDSASETASASQEVAGGGGESSNLVVPDVNTLLFAEDPVLQKRYRAEQTDGTTVETYTSPPWIGLPMGIKTVRDGLHTIILHRQKMKDIDADFNKAQQAACEYAHARNLQPENIKVIIILSIKEPKKKTERLKILQELKEKCQGPYFPLASRIEFGIEP
jgi:hypothetical protein